MSASVIQCPNKPIQTVSTDQIKKLTQELENRNKS